MKNKLILMLVPLLFSSCIFSGPRKFYRIEPLCGQNVVSTNYDVPQIGIRRLLLPEYLDRDEIVLWIDRYQVEIGEDGRWAEPLVANILSVLKINLDSILGKGAVVVFPYPVRRKPKVEIFVNITELRMSRNFVKLKLLWSLSTTSTMRSGSSSYAVPVKGDTNEAIVDAVSQVLKKFSVDFSAVLSDLCCQP